VHYDGFGMTLLFDQGMAMLNGTASYDYCQARL
jgi:hypothetical protein